MPTDENEVIMTGIAECESAYGLYINVDMPWAEATAEALAMARAKKKAEVGVKYRGVMKEYTFVDFFTRLGFYVYPIGQ